MKGFSLSTKIILLVCIIIALTVILSCFSIFKITKIGNEIKEISEGDIPLTKTITNVTVNQLEQGIWLERILRVGEIKISKNKDKFLDNAEKRFLFYAKEVENAIKKLKIL